MKRLSAAALILGLSTGWAQAANRDFPFSSGDLPAGCKVVPGLFPVGIRTSMVYDYKRYAGAMPPLVSKNAESLSCDGQKGSLYYFEYANADDRDQAELFAKPILSREENVPHPVEIVEWPKGFVVVSFKNPSPDLLSALNNKAKSGSTSATAKGFAPMPLATLPATSPAPPAVSQTRRPSASVVHETEMKATPIDVSATASPLATSQDLNQMVTNRPGAPLSDEPPMDNPHALKVASALAPVSPPEPVKPVVSVKKPTPVPLPGVGMAPPAKIVPPASAVLPVPVASATSMPAPSPVRPSAAVVPVPVVPENPKVAAAGPVAINSDTIPLPVFAGVRGIDDVADSVIVTFAGKLDCANPDLKEQGRIVCSVLNDFRQGTKPDLPANSGTIRLGPVYTVDEYGRLTDMHYDVLAGSETSGQISFFAVVSNGGREDFELQSLVDSRRNKQPLRASPTLTHIQQLAMKKHMPVVATTQTSALILPGGPRRLYMRKAGDHWVIVGPSGATTEAQAAGSFVLATLY